MTRDKYDAEKARTLPLLHPVSKLACGCTARRRSGGDKACYDEFKK